MNQKLTIGFVTSSLSSVDGWGRYSRSLIESVAKQENVKILTAKDAENNTKMKLDAVLPHPNFGLLNQIKASYIMIKKFKGCDVIHSLVEPYSPAAAFASIVLRIPFVCTMHGTYSVPPRRLSIQKLLMMLVYKRVKIATTGSKYTEQKAREVVSFGECRFIPNGVDPSDFYVLKDVQKKQTLFTVGELKPRKGADVVVRALGILKDKFPDLKYNIAGNTENNDFVDKIKVIAEELKISDRVIFLGRISDEELLRQYNECQAFVLAARDAKGSFEGFPMVFYEANACGTPVVTTKGFGSEYAIKDGENGFVVESDNPKVLADAIEKIISDPIRQEQMAECAKREAANHTWDKISLQLINLYKDAKSK